jgi:hypothetical protein
VAWGSSGDDLAGGGYSIAGSDMAGLRLSLVDPLGFGELYHAIAANVTILKGHSTEVSLGFNCHTNLLHVKVGSVAATRAEEPVEVYVTGKQNVYTCDGSICLEAEEQTYPSSNTGSNGPLSTHDVRLLRLQKDFHTDNPLMLHVERGGEPLFEPQDIVDLLLRSGYETQDDFDRAYEHTIEIGVDPVTLQITVTINGFTIVYPQPGDIGVIEIKD